MTRLLQLSPPEAMLLTFLGNETMARFDTMAAADLMGRGLADITGEGTLFITAAGREALRALPVSSGVSGNRSRLGAPVSIAETP